MSCGKEKDNSHVPSGRVAHMTVTQHTPDTAYRLEYTFEWQDTLLEGVSCLLPDGRTERMECRYSGTRLTETAIYTTDGAMRERWTYTYSDGKLARQTLTMQGGTTDCTFAYDGAHPVSVSYRRQAADGREHDYEHRFAWQGGNVKEESIREDGTEVQRAAFRYGDTPNPLRLPLGMGTVHLLEPDPYGSDGGILPHASAAFQRGLPRGGSLRRGGIVHGRVHLRHRRPPRQWHPAAWQHPHRNRCCLLLTRRGWKRLASPFGR